MEDALFRLEIDAGHPAAGIAVLDDAFEIVGQRLGRLALDLPAGLYSGRFRLGDAEEERFVPLLPGHASAETVRPTDLRFTTAAPIAGTRASHPDHAFEAGRLSRTVSAQRGSGARLFVFVRDLDDGGSEPVARGLRLIDRDDDPVFDFGSSAESSTDTASRPWAGLTLEAAPGLYRMRLETEGDAIQELPVPLSRGWQTQVFLMRRDFGETGRRIDFASAEVVLVPYGSPENIGPGFEPYPVAMTGERWAGGYTALAIQALQENRPLCAPDVLERLLEGQPDPILTLMLGHLLAIEKHGDPAVLSRTVGRLEAVFGAQALDGPPLADFVALDLLAAQREGRTVDPMPVTAPPLMRRSWQVLVAETARRPDLIAAGSPAAAIGDRLLGESAWMIWDPLPPRQRGRRTGSRVRAVRRGFHTYAGGAAFLVPSGPAYGGWLPAEVDVAADPVLRDLVLDYARQVKHLRAKPYPLPGLPDPILDMERLILAFGLPAARLQPVIAALEADYGPDLERLTAN